MLDALVLSRHGHYDHFGGLAGFLRASRGRLRPKIPFDVSGEECFCSREWTGPPQAGDFGALDRQAAGAWSTSSGTRRRSRAWTRCNAVLGGFHLAPYKDDDVHEVVAGMKGLDVGRS